MKYQVEYTPQAVEDLKGLPPTTRSLLYGWIEKNLVDCEDPRRHGSGDSEGGRWRYQIGEYRILAQIQDNKIVILTVLSGLRRTAIRKNSGKTKPSLSSNVFLRSTLRQPVKTALLLVVLALITFAFVSRSAEYLLVRQETERLRGFYRTIGTLESAVNDPWADTSEAVDYLENSPYVEFVDGYHYTSGVIQDGFGNADTDLLTSDMSRYLVFCGTLWDYSDTYFHFIVDSILAGSPEYIKEGLSVILHRTESQDIPDAQLVVGERYLGIGYYSLFPPSGIEIDPATGRMTGTHALLSCSLEDDVFYRLSEGQEIDWSDPKLEEVSAFIRDIKEEQASLNVIPTKDMSALPLVQGTAPQIYLTEGRWLDSQDNAGAVKACVVHAGLASSHGLALGDTITLELRDIPSCFGYFQPFPMWHYRGSSGFQSPLKIEPDGSFSKGDLSSDTRYQHIALSPGEVQTSIDTFEIVGIYDYMDKYERTVVRNFVYIPASTVPEGFSMTTAETLGQQGIKRFELLEEETYSSAVLPSPGAVSFVLNSPDAAEAFRYAARNDLSPLGFQISLLDNGWEEFQAAAAPMRKSSLLNALLFSALLVVVFCLAAVIYYRMRQREIAIARALGVPVRSCVWDVSVPLLLLGIAGIGTGGILGWQYTLNNAGRILQALTEFGDGKAAELSIFWLAALLGGALLLLVWIIIGGASVLSSRPVLVLIQGGALTAWKERGEPVPPPAVVVPSAQLATATVPYRTERLTVAENMGAAHVLRFVLRHITRSKLKSVLAILLAFGFTAGLAAIQLSIAGSQNKIDWLYENTSVEAELVQADTSKDTQKSSGFIRLDTINTLLQSGYITDAYLEGAANGAVIRYVSGMEDNQAVHVTQEDLASKTVRAFEDEKIFLSVAGSGAAVTITYFDGWDGSLFAQEWREGGFPVVLPKAVYEEFGDKIALSCKGNLRVCEVAGYYEGNVVGESGDTDPVLIPLNAYQQMSSRLVYCKAHVTLNPSLNRELEAFTQAITEISTTQRGAAALRALIWDEELRLAVAPLENSIKLMQVLYPVTLVVSLLAAAGLAVLFVMTSAKETAIMRVLGTSRLRSGMMLALQTAFTSIVGLLVGLAGILLYIGWTQPELLAGLFGISILCAVLYLLSAILGSAVSASIVTSKNPLELLQVKE